MSTDGVVSACYDIARIPASAAAYSPITGAGALIASVVFCSYNDDLPSVRRIAGKGAVIASAAASAVGLVANALGVWEAGHYCWLGPASGFASAAAVVSVAAVNLLA